MVIINDMCIYIYIYTHTSSYNYTITQQNQTTPICALRRGRAEVRPVRLLGVWVSKGLTQADS